jgi:hypothetical protein
MELFGIRLIGINEENAHKLVLTVAFIAAILLLRAATIAACGSSLAGTATSESTSGRVRAAAWWPPCWA